MTNYRNIIYGTIVVVCGFLLVFLIGFISVYSSFLKDLSSISYVSFNSEKVDTISKIVGEKRICSYESYMEKGNERYEIKYCDSISNDEFNKYTVYLMNDGFVEVSDDKNVRWYVKDSVDSNKIIGIYIDEVNSIMIYQKTDGYLNEEQNGNADHL